MAVEVGTVTVPMLITISAGKPAREIASVITDMQLSITGEPRPIGASSATVHPTTGTVRASIARALREAADEIEQQVDTYDIDRLHLDR
jgi:hypothetical protein